MKIPSDAEWAEYFQGGEPDLYVPYLKLKHGTFWRLVYAKERFARWASSLLF